jgi:hypothetical protein
VLDVAGPNQRAVRCYLRLGFRSVDADWRDAGYYFDNRVLDDPHFEHVRQFFRNGQRGLWVQFFEMRLDREDWFALRQNQVNFR